MTGFKEWLPFTILNLVYYRATIDPSFVIISKVEIRVLAEKNMF